MHLKCRVDLHRSIKMPCPWHKYDFLLNSPVCPLTCLLPATPNKTDRCCLLSGGSLVLSFFYWHCVRQLLATGINPLLNKNIVISRCRRGKILVTRLQLSLYHDTLCDCGYPALSCFLPSSLSLSSSLCLCLCYSLRHAQFHQVPWRSNRHLRWSGVVRMPGGRWAQTSHYLDEEGEESQLSALWGKIQWSWCVKCEATPHCSLTVWMCVCNADRKSVV